MKIIVNCIKWSSNKKFNCTKDEHIYTTNQHMLIFCAKIMALEGWMNGWIGGRVGGRAGLRIAYSNQKF